MRKLILTITLMVLALLIGCREAFSVHALQKPNDGVVLNFSPDSGRNDTGVEINILDVGRIISPDNRVELVWVIQTKSGKPQKMTAIEYGVIPPGFEEVRPAQKLVSGETYDVLASKPGSVGGTRFKKE